MHIKMVPTPVGRYGCPDGLVREASEAQFPWEADSDDTMLVIRVRATGKYTIAPHAMDEFAPDAEPYRWYPSKRQYLAPLPMFDTVEEAALYASLINATNS